MTGRVVRSYEKQKKKNEKKLLKTTETRIDTLRSINYYNIPYDKTIMNNLNSKRRAGIIIGTIILIFHSSCTRPRKKHALNTTHGLKSPKPGALLELVFLLICLIFSRD